MGNTVSLGVWVLCAQSAVSSVGAVAHQRSSVPKRDGQAPMAPKYEHIVFRAPQQAEPGTVRRLPTNEENALIIVEDGANEDTDNIAEVEELLKNPIPEAEIEAEREALQESGALPPGKLVVKPPVKDKDGDYYNEGVNETSKIFDGATSTVDDDGAEPLDDEDMQLKHELEDHLAALDNLNSPKGESMANTVS
ncbi:retiin, putative [Babesia caballi]|uniref:Retiin, putative n=1 Tax=Babesia caballi TaxID=5871 RepID=A0AAV4M081_BABCB|nr:retiin, putative [Babesia caballi]